MFVLNEDKSIYITRGDVAFFSVAAKTDTGEIFKFQPGDVVRFKVYEKRACENVVLSKNFGIEAETEEVGIYLEEKDTKIGDVISKPTEYWYEVELNPYTDPQTILGYDEDGAKVFMLYPEGNETEDSEPITPEDIPVVDKEMSLTSERPVQNQAITRAIMKVKQDAELRMNDLEGKLYDNLTDAKGRKVINVAEPVADTDAATKGYVDKNCVSVDKPITAGFIKNTSNEFAAFMKERTVNNVTYRAFFGLGKTGDGEDAVGSICFELRSSADNYASIVSRLEVRADGKITTQMNGKTATIYDANSN